MPEQPPAKLHAPLPARLGRCAPHARYAELHCKTNFSFLCGASHPDELVNRAIELGYAALAVTDRNSLAGVVRAHVAAKAVGLKLIIGAEITPADGLPILLYAPDIAAYRRLSKLITHGRRNAVKGECHLTVEDMAEYAQGLLAAVVPQVPGGAIGSRSNVDESDGVSESQISNFKSQISNLKSQISNLKSQISNFKFQISNLKSPIIHELERYREIFGDRCYLAAALHLGPDDDERLEWLAGLARRARVSIVATNDVHYHDPARRYLQDVLVAIREGSTVAELGARRFPNSERYLKSPAQIAELFRHCPAAIEHALELAGRCTFSLDELRYEYPEELAPPGVSPLEYLVQLTWDGARQRYPDGVPDKVRSLLEKELRLIEELHYEAYFLTVWDLVRFARSRNILCQGRGSAANSAVCFCLGITSVDPDRTDLLFERFISRERAEAPDIDVDFEHERREEVIQYVYQKYGRDRAGITAEVITYRPRSAVREVGKTLGLSLDRVDVLAKVLDEYRSDVDGESEKGSGTFCAQHPSGRSGKRYLPPFRSPWAARVREAGMDPQSPVMRQLVWLARELLGFPRHLSQHVGGFVITRGPLSELVPIENAAMPDRTVIEWDKDDLDSLGILKVDCLALGMLTAIHKCFELIEGSGFRVQGSGAALVKGECRAPSAFLNPEPRTLNPAPDPQLTLARIPPEDPAVFDMICRADTVGVFQIESRAQMSMLPRLRPRSFYDLVIEVAIVRPGPIQGGMVHPYLRRRRGDEPVTYPSTEVKQVLEKTLGVPLFQEQVMRLAMVAAGFTPGEADQLRRAMGAWRRPGLIEQFRTRLRDGMLARGYAPEYAEQIFQQIAGFGEYGFPESHAASFALLAYVSAWLKHYHPAAFTAAILNSQPMGFYAPAQLVRDARAHGVEVRPVDVNASEWDCTLEGVRRHGDAETRRRGEKQSSPRLRVSASPRLSARLRLGFRMIKGLPGIAARAIVRARGDRPFASVADFVRRTGLSKPVLVRLAQADAFGSLGLARRAALWQMMAVEKPTPLFAGLQGDEALPALPQMPLGRQVVIDYRTVGLSLKAHPMGLVRPRIAALKAVPASALEQIGDGSFVSVAGLVLVRQQPGTANGIVFATLEDETGVANLIIRPAIWQRYRTAARGAVALLARGKLQRTDGVTHVLVNRLEELSSLLPQIAAMSRDFR
jgi:error-prone DNA polymerase